MAERARLSEVAAAAAVPAPQRVSLRYVRTQFPSCVREEKIGILRKQEWTTHRILCYDIAAHALPLLHRGLTCGIRARRTLRCWM